MRTCPGCHKPLPADAPRHRRYCNRACQIADRGKGATSVRFHPDLYDALTLAAAERGLSINYLVNAAVRDFLPRLIPAEELSLTRKDPT